MTNPKSEIRNPKSGEDNSGRAAPLNRISIGKSRNSCPDSFSNCNRSSPLRGFTLVELLVTIAVIAILASLLLGALYTSQDFARAQKTRSTIAKLHTMMMARWESYKTRRVPITIQPGTPPNVAALMRLTALRELMRLELPDRNTDILVPPPTSGGSNATVFQNVGVSGNTMVVPWPSLNTVYRRRLGTPADTINAGAESLYLILTTSLTDDESGREAFGDSEVGDTDADGRSEFIDAWGKPISWIRWPAGFVSELQPLDPITNLRDPVKNHDPFDPRRVDAQAYALFPLILSSGPDGLNENDNNGGYSYVTNNPMDMSSTPLNPYVNVPPQMGAWGDTNSDTVNDSIDNIHNHLIGSR